MNSPRLVEIGRIVSCHGVRGEVRVLPYNPDSTLLHSLKVLHLRAPDHTRADYGVVGSRPHKRFVLIRLDGVHTKEDAEALVGRTVHIARELLPQVGPDQVYHTDLVGCVVSTESGEGLGQVSEIITTGSNDVCVVVGNGREYLIPLIQDVVLSLDVETREMVIRPLPGLLD